jgi:peptidoglycan-N-acetylglucosamine deacetylase
MNILTFDIEEWFHILDNDNTKGVNEWTKFESRIHKNMDVIFDIIDKSNASATFFVVGWLAKKYPEIIREISKRGFEIGSHTHLHQLVFEQNQNSFFNDVEKSIKTIEDHIGKKVTSFRAPGFSITENNKWAFEVLYELGIQKDSSVFPTGRAHGGFPSYKEPTPSIIEYNGIRLKEFPINTQSILTKSVVFSGGGYFRLLPYFLIKSWTNQSDYVMTYFHPRDFDYEQPMIPGLSLPRKLKSYVGLKGSTDKLEKWISDFNFIDLETADKLVNWDIAPIVKL